jgi:predicted neuraminidase
MSKFLWAFPILFLLVPIGQAKSEKCDAPFFSGELIFEPGSVPGYPSCHASTLVELPDGELLAAWFAGTKEGAADTAELGARLPPTLLPAPSPKGGGNWSAPKVLVDTPGKSDGNCVLHVDRKGRVWIFYVTKENTERRPQWAQCRVKCRVSDDAGHTFGPERVLREELGWMVRNKPIYLENGTLLLPIYDERNWSSLMFLSPDEGETWSASERISTHEGNIQPTVAQLRDGSLLAIMRTGSAQHRLWKSTSNGKGRKWMPPAEMHLPNPNSACDMVRLANGHLVLVFNDSPRERTPLTVALSADEGKTWTRRRNLETGTGEFSYPAVIQTRDGLIHVTYTWKRTSIKHVAFNEAWITQ